MHNRLTNASKDPEQCSQPNIRLAIFSRKAVFQLPAQGNNTVMILTPED